MTIDRQIEYLRCVLRNYCDMSGDYIPILDTIEAELNRLRKENERLIRKYNDLKFFVQSVADGDYHSYQEGAQRLLKSHGEL